MCTLLETFVLDLLRLTLIFREDEVPIALGCKQFMATNHVLSPGLEFATLAILSPLTNVRIPIHKQGNRSMSPFTHWLPAR